MTGESSAEPLRVFPWMRAALGGGQIDRWQMIDAGSVARTVADLGVTTLSDLQLAELLPGLGLDSAPWVDAAPVRLARAAEAAGLLDGRSVRVADLLALPNVGRVSVRALLERLAQAALGPMALPTPAPDEGVNGRAGPVIAGSDLQLLDDLRVLARAALDREEPDAPLLLEAVDPEPPAVGEARRRLMRLTARDVVAFGAAPAPPEADDGGLPGPLPALGDLVAALSERSREVLLTRVLAAEPVRLAVLGEHFGVTRERVRQIELRLRERLERSIGVPGPLHDLGEDVARLVHPVAPLGRLTDLAPVLSEAVPGTDVALWHFLARIDPRYEAANGWAATPDLATVVRATHAALAAAAGPHGVVDLGRPSAMPSGFSLESGEFERWLRFCGVTVYDGHALLEVRSRGDRVAALLQIAGRPLEVRTLIDQLPTANSIASLRNLLLQDSRFVASGRGRFSLVEWGHTRYGSIEEQIDLVLTEQHGRVPLTDLIERLTEEFDVRPDSVRTYANSGSFRVIDGVVRRVVPGAVVSSRSTAESRRVYRASDAWLQRIDVTDQHRGGVGPMLAMSLAARFGLRAGSRLEFTSADGRVTISWDGRRAQVSTIRRFLRSLEPLTGSSVFLRFGDDGVFAVRAVPTSRDPGLTRALALVGSDAVPTLRPARMALNAAIETRGRSWDELIALFHRRGDRDVAAALEGAPEIR